MPDVLIIYNQLQAFPGVLPWRGGLLDQPYMLMLELAWCREGVDRYQAARAAVARAKTDLETESERMAKVLAQDL